MRILLFIDILGSGGAQRQIVGLAELLCKQGHDVLLLDYWDSVFYDEYLMARQIPFEHCLTKGKWNILQMFKRKVESFQPEVVIAYLDSPTIIACLGKLCSRHKFRLIVSERNTTQYNNWKTRLRMHLFRLADVVVPNSYSQQAFIDKNYPFLHNKVVTITNMVDTLRFKPAQNKSQNEVSRFVVVGRVVAQKNPLRFIEAVKLLKEAGYEFRVDWYGDPYPQSYYEQCQKLIQEQDLQACFQFHPATQDIVSVYHEADAFVLPSIYEGFPNVLCEAMACGLPVIASNVCDNPHILCDTINGYLVNPHDAHDISAKMQQMLTLKPEERMQMGLESEKIISERFSIQSFERAYNQLIIPSRVHSR